MAATFTIKPKENCTIDLTMQQIAELGGLRYGRMDNECCLEFGEVGKFTIMYDGSSIGRGIEVTMEDNAIIMRLPLPATETDIRLTYDLARKLCEKFGTDSFVCDEEIVPFEHINVGIERLVSASTDAIVNMGNQIKNGEQHSFLIFGAVNRITFGMPEAEEINGSLEAFEKLLHRLQSMDVFYAAPRYYQLKDGTVFGRFFVRDGVTTVMPRVPGPIWGPIEKLKGYYVYLPDDNEIPYNTFAENVKPIGDYDSGHVMVCLTEKNVTYLAENCAVSVDTDQPRKGVFWGRRIDNGWVHENKIKNMQLAAPEYSGFNHLAVFLRWAAEKDMLSDKLIEAIPNIKEIIADGKADIRRIIAEHKAFNGILRSYHFKKDVQVFASRFYVFGREGYPSCVDDYAEKQLGSEKYNCEEYKDEAYLFVPYDEKYYKGLSKYIEKEWKKFNR